MKKNTTRKFDNFLTIQTMAWPLINIVWHTISQLKPKLYITSTVNTIETFWQLFKRCAGFWQISLFVHQVKAKIVNSKYKILVFIPEFLIQFRMPNATFGFLEKVVLAKFCIFCIWLMQFWAKKVSKIAVMVKKTHQLNVSRMS